MTQMWMSVLLITEAAVHTLPARTHMEALPVPVLKDMMATDFAAQVTVHQGVLQFVTPPPVGTGSGVLFSLDFFLSFFLCLFVCCLFLCLFVSLSARLRENGWTDLHEIFREGVE